MQQCSLRHNHNDAGTPDSYLTTPSYPLFNHLTVLWTWRAASKQKSRTAAYCFACLNKATISIRGSHFDNHLFIFENGKLGTSSDAPEILMVQLGLDALVWLSEGGLSLPCLLFSWLACALLLLANQQRCDDSVNRDSFSDCFWHRHKHCAKMLPEELFWVLMEQTERFLNC